MNHEHLVELIPGYALDVLDVEEQVLVEAHVAQCVECREELESYRSAVSSLAFATEVREPSPELRERVLAQQVEDDVVVRSAQPEIEREEGWRAALHGLLAGPRWAAFATAALVIGLVIWNVWLHARVGRLNDRIDTLNRRLESRTEVVALLALDEDAGIALQGTEAAPLARAQLVPESDRQGATLVVRDLPAPPPGRVYQMWFIRSDGQRDSGGTFTVEGEDTVTYVHPPADISEYVAVGVTDEPIGGSPGPTGTKVLGGEL